MSKSKRPIPPKGAENISEILIEVGWALTCWEEAESAIVSLYEASLGNKILFEEHVENFCRLGRGLRIGVLKKKIEEIHHVFSTPSSAEIIASLTRLEKLGSLRNEIAHGICMDISSNCDGKEVMKGLYIMPSQVNDNYIHPSPKYAHNIQTIKDFWKEVRGHRWTLVQAELALFQQRPDDQGENGVVPSWTIEAVVGVLQRRYKPAYINEVIERALECDEQMKEREARDEGDD
jgi:hypothetical protein